MGTFVDSIDVKRAAALEAVHQWIDNASQKHWLASKVIIDAADAA